MAQTNANNIVIRGISSCVPAKVAKNAEESAEFSSEEIDKIVKMAGVEQRHVAEDGVCTSDLCVEAADTLIKRLDWKRETIDLLVFITQTPDYFMPSTSCVIQKRLGLSDSCAAFDVGLGCSGYPYGLCLVSKMLQGEKMSRALLLIGDTPNKICHPSDRSTRLIFGDAGTATALEASHCDHKFSFILQSDGRGDKDFIVRAGGFRDRFCQHNRDHFIEMNGANIFAFTMKRVPPLVKESLDYAHLTADDVDYYVFHQANKFIIEHLSKKLGLPRNKVPIVIDRFGNTGGASIPLTITQGGLIRPHQKIIQLLLISFGVGFSWASASIMISSSTILSHSEI